LTQPFRTAKPLYRRPWLLWSVGVLAVLGLAGFAVVEHTLHHLEPLLRRRVINTLATRFNAPVQLDALHITLLSRHGLEVSGEGLRILLPAGLQQSGTHQPLIDVERFDFATSVGGLLHEPTSIDLAELDGLTIHIPAAATRQQLEQLQTSATTRPKIAFLVHRIDVVDAHLILDTSDPTRAPRRFDIRQAHFTGDGLDRPLQYTAVILNPTPRGLITASGSFGPWQANDPQSTAISGNYSFDNADLGTIKGIGGTLNSKGSFAGMLQRLTVDGTADVPDFSLSTANAPMPLHTLFHAYVNGITGDTTLAPVHAVLGRSPFDCSGVIRNIKGQGHDIQLAVTMNAGRMQDLLRLAVRTVPPLMSGTLQMNAQLHIPPGRQRVTQKLEAGGSFYLSGVAFYSATLQDKVEELSLRAQGRPKEIHSGDAAPTAILSNMTARFLLRNAQVMVNDLDYTVPGASTQLNGVYSLDGAVFEFKGHVHTAAKISQMTTGWKSWLARVADPFFQKNGVGADIPVQISGTRNAPHFGLALDGSANASSQQIADDLDQQAEYKRNAATLRAAHRQQQP
jgi:hypothetical protein